MRAQAALGENQRSAVNQISVIIPTFNESASIADLISLVRTQSLGVEVEIIVVDGGSTDATAEIVKHSKATFLRSPQKGRSAQLNYGAAHSSYPHLFFLHADSKPPALFLWEALQALQHKAAAGCFRLQFDDDHWFLKANAWFTRFNINAFRFGDQGLFIKREAFEKVGGYREDLIVLEDQDIVLRLAKKGISMTVLPGKMLTSARKYRDNGVFYLQWVFFLIWLKFRMGKSQEHLISFYKKKILDHKIAVNDARKVREVANDFHQEPRKGKSKNAPG